MHFAKWERATFAFKKQFQGQQFKQKGGGKSASMQRCDKKDKKKLNLTDCVQ